MSQAAYLHNGQPVDPAHFYRIACDPGRSVVVEACAGAGKTWMLVSRILRALLDGCEPSQILAITFTRKAAGEMRERLQDWMREMAQQSHADRCEALVARGMLPEEAALHAEALAGLYGRWLTSGEAVQISTIHGWFSKLVAGMPLDVLAELGLAPQWQLIDDHDELWPELWGQWLRHVDAQEDGPLRAAFEWLLTQERRGNLESWLRSALSNRLELHLARQAGVLWDSVPPAAEVFDAFADVARPEMALGHAAVHAGFEQLGRELGQQKGKTAQAVAQAIVSAQLCPDLAQRADLLQKALLTDKGEPRKRLGEAASLGWAQDWLVELAQARAQQLASEMHRSMVLLSDALFEQYARLKHARGLADIVDLELAAARLLQDPALAGWVQERLDVQLRHVLMDEFQDTSPLQWATLHAWLSGYVGAGGGASGRAAIQVFVVGDPKQSIYRFRRADPRVFVAAQDFVRDGLEGDLLACDHTRRNAPGIIDLINQVMAPAAAEGLFKGYRPHTTGSNAHAQVCVLPEVLRPPRSQGADEMQDAEGWRDSLSEPRHEVVEVLKQQEADHVADAIAHVIDHQGRASGEVFVLARKRASLALVAQSLARRGIAHAAPENTLLIDTPEAKDLIAVMQAVVTPGQDLALAHALKTPALGCSDDVLMAVAAHVKAHGGTWWAALLRLQPASTDLCEADQVSLIRARTLLQAWQAAARQLPPHDLMQQIVDDAQWRRALAERLSPAMFHQALVHLDALLAQSLALHAGRHATPYRWLRELKRLREPLPILAVKDAVQLLTIHGAKGLEAPVVFLMDTDGQAARSDHHTVLVDWPQGAVAPARCAFVAREGAAAPSLAFFLAEEKLANGSEECNALYVALTRAREHLMISRTEPHVSNASGSWWSRLWSSGALGDHQRWCPLGDQAPGASASSSGDQRWRNTLWTLPELSHRPVATGGQIDLMDAPSDSPEMVRSALLGKALHRLMELVTPMAVPLRVPELVAHLARQATASVMASEPAAPAWPASETAQLVNEVVHTAHLILNNPEARPWLDPERVSWAGNEVVLWHEGQMLRIDRLVALMQEGQRHWWVLDYKLHPAPHTQPAYRAQIKAYMKAIEALEQTSQVHGAFIAGDGRFHPL